jgi:PUA domain protein
MGAVKNKHRLKQKDIHRLQDEIRETLDDQMDLSSKVVETGRMQPFDLVFIDGIPCFVQMKNQWFFTVKGLMHFTPRMHSVVVDMGAVKFVTNGADVMAPGVVDADASIQVNDAVWVCDETHRKPLAVGVAMMEGVGMKQADKGKAVMVVHHVGDRLWDLIAGMV